MASQVSFSGIGSGIDGVAVADALYDQLTISNTVRKNRQESVESENSSLEKLRELLIGFADQLDSLRTVQGGAGSKIARSSNTDVATVAADSGADFGAFDISVESLAKGATASFGRGFSSRGDFLVQDANQTGNVTFSIGQGEDAREFSISVGELTTADGFIKQFNEKAGGLASASLVNLGTSANPEYRLRFATTETGTEKGFLSASVDNEALLGSSALGALTTDQATNAVFSVSGIAGKFERESNTISDVVSGVTFQVKGVGDATVSVGYDSSAASKQLESIISAFNSIAKFVGEEDAISSKQVDGELVNKYGSLARSSVDDQAFESLRSALHSATSSDGSVSLASLGVSTERDGTLSFDVEAFEKAFNADPSKVSEVMTSLADKVGGVQGVVHQFAGYGNTIDKALASNELEMGQITESINRTERSASVRQDAMLKQFQGFEYLIGRLNMEASVISGLLNF